MPHKDWIPAKEQDLLDLCAAWEACLQNGGKVYAFGWDAAECNRVLQAIAAFTGARAAYALEATPENRIKKDETKDGAVAAMRGFVNAAVRFNAKMKDEDKMPLGLHARDTKPTPHPAPQDKPDTTADPSGKGRHTVTALNPRTHKNDKPAFVERVVYAARVRDASAAPSRAEEMPSDSRAAATRDFQWTESGYGKVADYATAYEGSGGKRGPWSDVVSVIIA